MDHMPLLAVLFYSIPESILFFTYGYVLLRKRFDKRAIINASMISVLTSYFVRTLPIPFGLHSLIGVVVVSVLFTLVCKFPIKQGVIASVAGVVTGVALENICLYFIHTITGWSVAEMLGKGVVVRTLIGYPLLITWALLTYLIYKKKFTLVGGERLLGGDERF